jgi:hypothetical protein
LPEGWGDREGDGEGGGAECDNVWLHGRVPFVACYFC